MKRVSALWTKDKVYSECRFHGKEEAFISKVSYNSNEIDKETAFVALCGTHTDGHLFIDQAIATGAPVIIHSAPLETYYPTVLYIQHPNPKRVASLFAFSLTPTLPSTIIGVTGTDGKSSTSDFLYQMLCQMGLKCGLLTTVSYDDGEGKRPSPFKQSTPEAPQIFSFLQTCVANSLDIVIIEATSHGLSYEGSRLIDIPFSGAIFTTITTDHLDYHHTLEAYVDAKMNLARQVVPNGWVVLSESFPLRQLIIQSIAPEVEKLLYSFDERPSRSLISSATLSETLLERTISVTERESEQRWEVTLPYGQACYTENGLAALIATQKVSQKKWEELIGALGSLQQVSGRFEVVTYKNPVTTIIDFAHTSDAFRRIFTHISTHQSKGNLIALFGAAGERDSSKRKEMGHWAALFCNTIYLCDEDPRSEDPTLILDQLEEGIRESSSTVVVKRIHNRRDAIYEMVMDANEDDILLFLGKGHERFFHHKEGFRAYSERSLIEQALLERGKR